MARKRAIWTTTEKFMMYEFQRNNYEEVRILMNGDVFRRFTGQNKFADAKHYWELIKKVNE